MRFLKYFLIIFIPLLTISSKSKAGLKELKIIFMVDNMIAYDPQIKDFYLYFNDKPLNVKYDFGRVYIPNNEYQYILESDNFNLRFEFSYIDIDNNRKSEYINYHINTPRAFFLQSLLIIKIYNSYIKENRKTYYFDGKPYLIEFKAGAHSSILVRNKRD